MLFHTIVDIAFVHTVRITQLIGAATTALILSQASRSLSARCRTTRRCCRSRCAATANAGEITLFQASLMIVPDAIPHRLHDVGSTPS